MPPWAHSSTLTLCTYIFWLSDRSPRERCTVTTQYVLSTYCLSLRPFHTWLRLLSPHILYITHSTLCLFTSHLFSLCWCFTHVVNHLSTTIAHHIFSSVLAEQQFIHSFVHSFACSFIHSFIHTFTRSVIESFTHSFVHSITHCSILYSYIQHCRLSTISVINTESTCRPISQRALRWHGRCLRFHQRDRRLT